MKCKPHLAWIALAVLPWMLSSCSEASIENHLSGCWIRQDAKVIECWAATEEGWTGDGFSISGHGDTTRYEQLDIQTREGRRVYIATIAGSNEEVPFSETDTPWLFENPDHDMPRSIRYEFIDGSLFITLGSSEGNITWVYTRLDEEQ